MAQVIRGEWDVAAVSARAWDIADKTVGTVGGGRIGTGLVRRLKVLREALFEAFRWHTLAAQSDGDLAITLQYLASTWVDAQVVFELCL